MYSLIANWASILFNINLKSRVARELAQPIKNHQLRTTPKLRHSASVSSQASCHQLLAMTHAAKNATPLSLCSPPSSLCASSSDPNGSEGAMTLFANCSVTADAATFPGEGPSASEVVRIVFLSLLATGLVLLTTGGNLLVIFAFKVERHLRTVSNYFLLSLAVADLIIGVVSMPLFTMHLLLGRWPFPFQVCDLWLSIDYTVSNASVANLLIISIDRYLSVTRPLTYRVGRTPRRAGLMIGAAWIVSFVLWTPWIYAWPSIEGKRKVPPGECYIQFLNSNPIVTILTAVAAFYLPVTIMTILYLRIYVETKRRQRELGYLTADRPARRWREGLKTRCKGEAEGAAESAGTAASKWLRWACCRTLVDNDADTSSFSEVALSSREPSLRLGRNNVSPRTRKSTAASTPSDAAHQLKVPLLAAAKPPPGDGAAAEATEAGEEEEEEEEEVVVTVTPAPSAPPPSSSAPTPRAAGRTSSGKSNVTVDSAFGSMVAEESGMAGPLPSSPSRLFTRGRDSFQSRRSEEISPAKGSFLLAKSQSVKVARRKEHKNEKKAAKTLSAILLAFIITWTPYNVFAIINAFPRRYRNECGVEVKEEVVNSTLYNCGECGRDALFPQKHFQKFLIRTLKEGHLGVKEKFEFLCEIRPLDYPH